MSHGELRASRGYRALCPRQPRYKAFCAGEPRSLQLEAAGCASGLHSLPGKLNHLSVGQTWVQVQTLWPTGVNGDMLQNRIYSIGSLGRLNVKHLLGA